MNPSLSRSFGLEVFVSLQHKLKLLRDLQSSHGFALEHRGVCCRASCLNVMFRERPNTSWDWLETRAAPVAMGRR